ncbi:MAG: LPXTG cell wall anchor domain-containing protein [Blautia sp.]|nr:LPXTG cell wall anchor domain-containing protein [Blautia sp.]
MAKVGNEPGAALPNTGGPGTSLIYLLGTMLTGIAGAGTVMKRRRKAA